MISTRMLQTIVGIEWVAFLVLGTMAWQRCERPAPASTGPGRVVEAARGIAETGSMRVERESSGPSVAVARIEDATANSADGGTNHVVLTGRLTGVDLPIDPASTHRFSARRGDSWRTAKSTPDGSYAIAGLAPGAWDVLCQIDGYRALELTHELDQREIQHLDLPLQRAAELRVFAHTASGERLQSRLTQAGLWQGLHVVATREPLHGDLAPTEQSSPGDFGVGRLRRVRDRNARADSEADDGVLQLDVDPPVHAALLLRHMVLARQRVEVGQTELRFTVPFDEVAARFGSVAMRIVDGSGQPVAGAGASLSTAQGGGQRGTSDAQGFCRIDGALPGLGAFSISARGLEGYHTHVTLAPGEALDLGEVVLYPPTEVLGRVVSAAGEPTRATVQWTNLDLWRPPHPLMDRRSAGTDLEGNFGLWQAGPRRYSVRARSDEGHVGFAIVDARNGGVGGDDRHEIVVRPAHRVTFRAATPLDVRVVVLEDPDGRVLEVVRTRLRWPEATASLPDGDYVMSIYDGSGTRLTREPLRIAGADLTRQLP